VRFPARPCLGAAWRAWSARSAARSSLRRAEWIAASWWAVIAEAIQRGARMLRTALGPTIARFLEDPAIVGVMLNPDGRIWVDRLSEGLSDTGETMSAADGERIVRLVAHHVAPRCTSDSVSEEACRARSGAPL
jgi:Flp pilus assembly CpaF family ATPase